MEERVKFFYDNAPYSWDRANGQSEEDGHQETARALAAAEIECERRGWRVQWEHDPYVMDDDVGSVELVASGQAINLDVSLWEIAPDSYNDRCLASLSGVVVEDEDSDYLRVVGAQLAAEALDDEKAEMDTRTALQTATVRDLIAELAESMASDPDADHFLVDEPWAQALIDAARPLEDRSPRLMATVPVRLSGLDRLRELATEAEEIAVTGQLMARGCGRGGYTRLASDVMHEMRSVIRHSLMIEGETND